MQNNKIFATSIPTKFCLSLALAVASLSAMDANAAVGVTVTSGGTAYTIGSVASIYSAPSLNYAAQPWWGSQSLATSLAGLVASSLGTPNFGTFAPYFAYGLSGGNVTSLYNNGSGTQLVSYSTAANYWTMYLISMVGPSPSITNLAAFNQSLTNASSTVSMTGAGLPALSMEGAHHRTLLDSGLTQSAGNGVGFWTTADTAHFNSSDSDMQIAEVGVYKDIGTARLGIGAGQVWDRQGLSLGGHATNSGQYFLAEVDKLFTPHIEGSITGYYGKFNTQVNRNYQNGASTDTSTGNTDTTSSSVRIRLDLLNVATIAKFALSPYAAYTWSRADVGAYTEFGGSFPVSYNANNATGNNVRVGLGAKKALSGSTDLVLNTEVVHSFEDNMPGTSGQIIGVSGFALPGQNVRQTWVRLMADVDHRLTDKSLISVGLNAGTQGGDPSYGGTISYRASF